MRRVKVRGGQRMKDLGYKQVQVWLDPEQYRLLRGAADKSFVPLSKILVAAAMAAIAGEVLPGWIKRLDAMHNHRQPKPGRPPVAGHR